MPKQTCPEPGDSNSGHQPIPLDFLIAAFPANQTLVSEVNADLVDLVVTQPERGQVLEAAKLAFEEGQFHYLCAILSRLNPADFDTDEIELGVLGQESKTSRQGTHLAAAKQKMEQMLEITSSFMQQADGRGLIPSFLEAITYRAQVGDSNYPSMTELLAIPTWRNFPIPVLGQLLLASWNYTTCKAQEDLLDFVLAKKDADARLSYLLDLSDAIDGTQQIEGDFEQWPLLARLIERYCDDPRILRFGVAEAVRNVACASGPHVSSFRPIVEHFAQSSGDTSEEQLFFAPEMRLSTYLNFVRHYAENLIPAALGSVQFPRLLCAIMLVGTDAAAEKLSQLYRAHFSELGLDRRAKGAALVDGFGSMLRALTSASSQEPRNRLYFPTFQRFQGLLDLIAPNITPSQTLPLLGAISRFDDDLFGRLSGMIVNNTFAVSGALRANYSAFANNAALGFIAVQIVPTSHKNLFPNHTALRARELQDCSGDEFAHLVACASFARTMLRTE